MTIEVKNNGWLFLYRNLWCKNIEFYTKENKYKDIVKVLNIKNRKERIACIYDLAIIYVNKYYSDDLCQFVNNQCVAQRNGGSLEINGCCKKCHLVTEKGCPSSNLPCKLIYCKTALGNVKLLKFGQIDILKCLSIKSRIILMSSFFNTREEILNDLNGGLVYSIIRGLKREFIKKKQST